MQNLRIACQLAPKIEKVSKTTAEREFVCRFDGKLTFAYLQIGDYSFGSLLFWRRLVDDLPRLLELRGPLFFCQDPRPAGLDFLPPRCEDELR
jgi:hypothetical protein